MRLFLAVSALVAFSLGCAVGKDAEKEGDEDTPTSTDDTTADTDPADADDDGDGLTNAEEEALGTDPAESDSDTDGYTDSEEIEAGTNPTWKYSHAFEKGDYLVGDCPTHPDEGAAGPTGTGSYDTYTWDAYQEGDVLANFTATDKFEQEVTPYTFCGNYTLVTMSAEWCEPCQALAGTMADDTDEIRAEVPNFTFYEFLYQDNYGDEPDASVLGSWSRSFDLDGIPVVSPDDNTDDFNNWLNANGGIPATLLLAPDMTVIWSGVDHPREYYLYDVQSILDAIADYEG